MFHYKEVIRICGDDVIILILALHNIHMYQNITR
jgi:hypothetical protein